MWENTITEPFEQPVAHSPQQEDSMSDVAVQEVAKQAAADKMKFEAGLKAQEIGRAHV